MDTGGFVVCTASDDPELADRIEQLTVDNWPAFVLCAHRPQGYPFVIDWYGIYQRWPQYQIALIEPKTGALVAAINALTFAWDGDELDLPSEGWDWAMHQARLDFMNRARPVTACALQTIIRKDVRGRRLSNLLIQLLKERVKLDGCRRLLAPVRPSLRARYLLTPLMDYISWTNGEGLPFDPWLRTHICLGGKMIKPCPQSSVKCGAITEWETWTGLQFPVSGEYIIPEALAPLRIDRDADEGICIEPNVWVSYDL